MPELRVDVTGSEAVKRMLDTIGPKLANRAMARAIEDLEDYIAEQAAQHNKNGALVRSLETKKLTPMDWVIRHRTQHAPHAVFVHDGTRPHKIAPRGGPGRSILRFTVGNKITFAREVNHPGYKGDRWMDRAADLAPRLFEKYVQEYLNAARK